MQPLTIVDTKVVVDHTRLSSSAPALLLGDPALPRLAAARFGVRVVFGHGLVGVVRAAEDRLDQANQNSAHGFLSVGTEEAQ